MRFVVCTAIALICTTLCAQTPARPQFEVASVKPAANDGTDGGRFPQRRALGRNMRLPGVIPLPDPGRLRMEDWALLDLIAAAYSVRASQVSGPAWLDDQSFDIDAKLPDGTKKAEVNAMLQSLLEERFGLKVHRGTQTKQGFALVVGKNGPKLKPAEPPAPIEGLTEEEQQAKARELAMKRMTAMMDRIKDGGAPLGGASSAFWDSTTTGEMAYRLERFAEGPVADETGLTERYSVTIQTWKNADVPGGTIFDALEKLGLKLEPRKVTVETVVVDQVSKTPTAN